MSVSEKQWWIKNTVSLAVLLQKGQARLRLHHFLSTASAESRPESHSFLDTKQMRREETRVTAAITSTCLLKTWLEAASSHRRVGLVRESASTHCAHHPVWVSRVLSRKPRKALKASERENNCFFFRVADRFSGFGCFPGKCKVGG